MACGKTCSQMVPTRYSYKEVPIRCGETAYDGSQFICEECTRRGVKPRPYDFLDAGEYLTEDDY